MSRKRKVREEKMNESWLLPYADMLTLLLALFIVLFASSTVDAEKYHRIMIALNDQFSGGHGILEQPIPPPISVEKDDEDDKAEDGEEAKKEQEREDLMELKIKIDQYIINNKLGGELETSLSNEGLLLTIMDNALFSSGSAEVREDALPIAIEIAQLLEQSSPRKIVVAGHTDNVPISNANFRSNWELSSHRALNFMKIILDNAELDPRNLSATGYGEYHPVATNDTAEGRAQNRRVEVLIMPMYDLN